MYHSRHDDVNTFVRLRQRERGKAEEGERDLQGPIFEDLVY